MKTDEWDRGHGLPDKTCALAEALASLSDEAVVVVGRDGRAYFARGGEPVAAMIGVAPELAVRDPRGVLGDAYPRVAEAYAKLRSVAGRRETITFWIRHHDGHFIQLRAAGSNQLDDELGAVLLRLAVVASKPSLGPPQSDPAPDDDEPPPSWRGPLLGEESFLELVQEAIDRKEEKIWRAPSFARAVAKDRRFDFSVVLVDIDRMKLLRGELDTRQLQTVLRTVAQRLAVSLRGRDAIGYVGGTELAILLDGVGDAEQTTRITDAFLSILEDRFEIDGRTVSCSPALGIATSERRYRLAEELMRDAGAAVSHAMRQKQGKRRQAYETRIRVEEKQSIVLMAELYAAAKEKEFHLAYQPVVSLRDGSLTGFEALARWTHPTLGVVPPSTFIPAAEEIGIIGELGTWVLEQACERMAVMTSIMSTPRPISMAVNVSALQLTDKGFVADVERALTRAGLAPQQLVLEITESVALHDLGRTKSAITRVKELGVAFALDDFGTGYSALGYLHELPYDRLKIDRSFVANLDDQREKVLTAIVRLAHSLGMEVVAEGVETPLQRGALERMSCDYAQGYLFSRPIDAEAADALVRGAPVW